MQHAARRRIGPDTGFDSIGDWRQAAGSRLISTSGAGKRPAQNDRLQLESRRQLRRSPRLIGNFQDDSIPGKIQFGSGWWFLDQKEAIEWQFNALSNGGLLSRFIGMLTDSRSFMSFPRHEYFRRVLCNLLGHDVENGELPNDEKLIGTMVRNICFQNAKNYLGLELGHSSAPREEQLVQK